MADDVTVQYVQVAVDGAGKKVGMQQSVDSAGNQIYLQKALLIGDPADVLSQLLDTERQILACLRALVRIQADITNSRTTEEDFSSPRGANLDG